MKSYPNDALYSHLLSCKILQTFNERFLRKLLKNPIFDNLIPFSWISNHTQMMLFKALYHGAKNQKLIIRGFGENSPIHLSLTILCMIWCRSQMMPSIAVCHLAKNSNFLLMSDIQENGQKPKFSTLHPPNPQITIFPMYDTILKGHSPLPSNIMQKIRNFQ